ncbi:malonyl-ACP O-methyltransferase BioC [Dokdonella sp.]|uniref:malonyl-ACP O-methyltransferase BioC n=1 Tax=Dokdonella sp. TaxID=2291710 RepID=UPI002C8DE785|nr:malonyl-ACP O-methyltransferase BioC [Dokdonella sp.]HOX71861.1 malonyl-ACP O-methyltransferase BioC [Dokdonella sp.]HPN78339.1 malonyl-ACP O-methyltransferase BioC [Dokdonella sp.]
MSGIFDTSHVSRAFGRVAASYDTHAVLQDEVQKRLQERLDDAPLEPRRVVDIGSGTGRGTAALRKRYPQAQTIALDLALPMLRAAKKHRGWLRPFARVCADVEALPFADASIDLLHSSLCLQWCGNLEAAFDGFRRVMRPQGFLLFSTFGPQTLHELRSAFADVDAKPHVSRFLDMHQIGDALLAAGFRDPVLARDNFTLTYVDVLGLMRELRAIGATNADSDRSRGLTGKGHLQRVVAAYESFRHEGRLPATYEVVYAQAWAPDAGQPRRSGNQDIASFPIDRLRGSRRSRN